MRMVYGFEKQSKDHSEPLELPTAEYNDVHYYSAMHMADAALAASLAGEQRHGQYAEKQHQRAAISIASAAVPCGDGIAKHKLALLSRAVAAKWQQATGRSLLHHGTRTSVDMGQAVDLQ